jgi:hypothetical protein
VRFTVFKEDKGLSFCNKHYVTIFIRFGIAWGYVMILRLKSLKVFEYMYVNDRRKRDGIFESYNLSCRKAKKYILCTFLCPRIKRPGVTWFLACPSASSVCL